ncbi:hypothetical protein ACIA8O_05510 [Kitasatospora sp. NPDC051853]|uniref:hypothetical protein n=1 Tax=Kitasatospora sp. NPDC051853 TaxID=3364058 RepID=UPI0037A68EDB
MRKVLPVIALAACLVAAAAPVATAAPHGAGWVSAFEPVAGAHAAGPLRLLGSARLDVQGPVAGRFDWLDLAVDARAVRRPGGGEPVRAEGRVAMKHTFLNEDGSFQGSVAFTVAVDCLTLAGPADAAFPVLTGRVERVDFDFAPGQDVPPTLPDWKPETSYAFRTGADGHPKVAWAVPGYGDPGEVARRCEAPGEAAKELYRTGGGFGLRR